MVSCAWVSLALCLLASIAFNAYIGYSVFYLHKSSPNCTTESESSVEDGIQVPAVTTSTLLPDESDDSEEDSDLLNLINDDLVGRFASILADKIGSAKTEESFLQITRSGREYLNCKVLKSIFTSLHEEFYEGEVKEPLLVYNASKLRKIKALLRKGIVDRLEPERCLKEFVEVYFEDLEITEDKLKGSECNANLIYNSSWYQTICRKEGAMAFFSGEEGQWCGPTSMEE